MTTTTCCWTQCRCCEPAVPGRSYCVQHVWRVYQQGTAARRRGPARPGAAILAELEQLFQSAAEELAAEGYDLNQERWD